MADPLVTYRPGEPFPGKVGRTLETSSPAWPARPQALEGSSNVVVIVLDDVGYGELPYSVPSTFATREMSCGTAFLTQSIRRITSPHLTSRVNSIKLIATFRVNYQSIQPLR